MNVRMHMSLMWESHVCIMNVIMHVFNVVVTCLYHDIKILLTVAYGCSAYLIGGTECGESGPYK